KHPEPSAAPISVWKLQKKLNPRLQTLPTRNQDTGTRNRTAEEIDQLTVDEDLNDVERAVYLLSVGQEVQRASVISNLPSLVRQNPAETFRRVVPKVRVLQFWFHLLIRRI
uniref:Protein phosphatase 4, regulatory subunit 4 n=1 Tax=Xiphophorus couchianus TaxID=32473 RepID=A0A3B5KUF3_9TELE